MSDIKKMTATTIFIVPTLKIDKKHLMNIDFNFINGYIKDLGREDNYEDAAYLLFKPKDLENFRDFVNGEYERTPNIIEDYDHDGGFVVLVYTLNLKFKRDFELIKLGQYSKTSEEFQNLFPRFKEVMRNGLIHVEMSLQHRIFNKTDDLKKYWERKIGIFHDDMEVWSRFQEEKETLEIEKIRELV